VRAAAVEKSIEAGAAPALVDQWRQDQVRVGSVALPPLLLACLQRHLVSTSGEEGEKGVRHAEERVERGWRQE
jgi:hypothetical protein